MIRNHATENGYHYKTAYKRMASSISTVLMHGCILSDNTIPTEHNCIRLCVKR